MFMNSIFFFNENNNLLSLSFANFGLLKSIYYFLLYTLFPSLLVGLSKIAEILIYSPLEIILPAGVTLASLSPFRLESLVDIACADYVQTQGRFLLFYPLLSHIFSLRVSVVTLAPDLKWLSSLCAIFPNANWAERESWDMFGLGFLAHPDLRRILTDYGFKGHPLRKDFPLLGYLEVSFNNLVDFIEYLPVSMSISPRVFDVANAIVFAFC